MGTLEQSIYFGMAQQEREYISQRTKAGLAVLKKRGVKLGAPNATFTPEMREKALEKRRKNTVANEANKRAYAIASVLTGKWEERSRYLNSNGFLTAKGKLWTGYQVRLLVESFQRLSS
jgi:DNA invertase Pin-like site-specific DNA recombinase